MGGQDKHRVEFLSRYIQGRLDASDPVLVLDYSGGLAGKYSDTIDVVKDGINVDPFGFLGLEKDLDKCCAYIRDFILVLSGIELEHSISTYVYKCSEQGDKPTLGDLAKQLSRSDLGYELEEEINNNFSILNGYINLELDRRWLCLDLSKLTHKHKAIVTLYVLGAVSLSIGKSSSKIPRNIIVHDACNINDSSAEKLRYLSRHLYRCEGSLVCSAPSFSDFNNNGNLNRIFYDSNWKCSFKLDEKSIKALRDKQEDLIIDEQLLGLKDSEFIIVGGGMDEIIKGRV